MMRDEVIEAVAFVTIVVALMCVLVLGGCGGATRRPIRGRLHVPPPVVVNL